MIRNHPTKINNIRFQPSNPPVFSFATLNSFSKNDKPIVQLTLSKTNWLLHPNPWFSSQSLQNKSEILPFNNSFVRLTDSENRPLGVALLNTKSRVPCKLISTDSSFQLTPSFFQSKLSAALSQRNFTFNQPYYRWVNADADGLPSLNIDRYHQTILVELNTLAYDPYLTLLVNAIKLCVPNPTIVFIRNSIGRKNEKLVLLEPEMVCGKEELDWIDVHEANLHSQFSLRERTLWSYAKRETRKHFQSIASKNNVLSINATLGSLAHAFACGGADNVDIIPLNTAHRSSISATIENSLNSHKMNIVASSSKEFFSPPTDNDTTSPLFPISRISPISSPPLSPSSSSTSPIYDIVSWELPYHNQFSDSEQSLTYIRERVDFVSGHVKPQGTLAITWTNAHKEKLPAILTALTQGAPSRKFVYMGQIDMALDFPCPIALPSNRWGFTLLLKLLA